MWSIPEFIPGNTSGRRAAGQRHLPDFRGCPHIDDLVLAEIRIGWQHLIQSVALIAAGRLPQGRVRRQFLARISELLRQSLYASSGAQH